MNENADLFLSVFKSSLPLIHRIVMKKIYNENNVDDYVCWGVTDALDSLLKLKENDFPTKIKYVPNNTKEFIDKIRYYLNEYHLLIFSQNKNDSCHRFSVLYSNTFTYIIEYGDEKNKLVIDKMHREDFVNWIEQLVERKITDRFYNEYITDMKLFIVNRKKLSLNKIGKFIFKNIHILE